MIDDSFVPSSKQPSLIYCRLADYKIRNIQHNQRKILWEGGKKYHNRTFKINFLHQKLSVSIIKNSLKPHFLLLTLYDNTFNFWSTLFSKFKKFNIEHVFWGARIYKILYPSLGNSTTDITILYTICIIFCSCCCCAHNYVVKM